MLERQRARHKLHATIVETRNDAGPMRIQHDRLRATQPLDVAIRSDAKNLIAADGNRFLKSGAAAWIHLAVDYDEIDRAGGVVALGANDQSCDERRPDNDDH